MEGKRAVLVSEYLSDKDIAFTKTILGFLNFLRLLGYMMKGNACIEEISKILF